MNHFSDMMYKSRHILMAALLTLLFATPSLQAAPGAPSKTGVVDFARILQQMPEAKKAETTLNTTAEPFKKELQRMNQDLQKSIATYGQAREGMSKQARDLKEKDLNLKAQAMEEIRAGKIRPWRYCTEKRAGADNSHSPETADRHTGSSPERRVQLGA